MRPAPLALACGHLVDGTAVYRWKAEGGVEVEEFGDPGSRSSTVVACPIGCGWQTWVADPFEPAPAEEV